MSIKRRSMAETEKDLAYEYLCRLEEAKKWVYCVRLVARDCDSHWWSSYFYDVLENLCRSSVVRYSPCRVLVAMLTPSTSVLSFSCMQKRGLKGAVMVAMFTARLPRQLCWLITAVVCVPSGDPCSSPRRTSPTGNIVDVFLWWIRMRRCEE